MSMSRLEIVGFVDGKLVEQAEKYEIKKKKSAWIRWGALAACLCLIAAAVIAVPRLTSKDEPDPVTLEREVTGDRSAPAAPQAEVRPHEDSASKVDQPKEQGDEPVLAVDAAPGYVPAASYRELTQSEALSDADFGAYMPKTAPNGFTEESFRRFEDQYSDYLSGVWTGGYDELSWRVSAFTEQDADRLTGIEETENYDLSLYPIPRAESVSEELRQIVNDPIFLAEELTLDAVRARAYKTGESGDSDGWRMTFSVKYGDILVRISAKGVEPQWIYEQLIGFSDQ